MLLNELEPKTVMFQFLDLFTTLSKNLFTKLNKINQQLLKLILVIQVKLVQFVDILKKPIVIKKYICLTAKTVVINQMMTELEQ